MEHRKHVIKKLCFKINIIINWILGMLINIACDIGFLVLGIFSFNARKTYIEKFYPQYIKKDEK